jgi:hypothetical protein
MKENYTTPISETTVIEAQAFIAASDGNPRGTLPGFTNGDFTL